MGIEYCSTCRFRTRHIFHRCETCHPPEDEQRAPACEHTIDLFGAGEVKAPAVADSPTSEAAAESVDVRHQCRTVLLHILEELPRPFTDNELVSALVQKGFSPNSPRARRVDLSEGPLKKQDDGEWRREARRGGFLEAVGERDGSTLWNVTDKAAGWYARNREVAA